MSGRVAAFGVAPAGLAGRIFGREDRFSSDQKAIDALGDKIARATEVAFNRGLELASGQPLEQAVATMSREGWR